MNETLTNDEILRYSRHLIMPEVALGGQQKLKAARVLCVGAGGLGSPVALYLAAAGVGTLGIVDFDIVDSTNLQRQIIHDTDWIGRSKVESAAERLRAINPEVNLKLHEMRLSSENALELLEDYDVIVDGTDNFATRYLLNDACVLTGKPYVYASVYRFEGQATVFGAPALQAAAGKAGEPSSSGEAASSRGPCYRCVYPEPPPPGMVPSCAEGGVLGVLPGLLGVIQATEAIKLILGTGETLAGRLLLVDALSMRFREVKLKRDPGCPVCGENPSVRELIDYEEFCGIRGEESADAELAGVPALTPEEIKRRLDGGEELLLLDVREAHEREICNLPGLFVPLAELPDRLHELDSAREIVAYCKTGVRSAQAVSFLRRIGFDRTRNLAGGIDAWAQRVDPSLPRY